MGANRSPRYEKNTFTRRNFRSFSKFLLFLWESLSDKSLLNPRSARYKQKGWKKDTTEERVGSFWMEFPRTRVQAEILDQIVDVDLVVNFKCTEEHLVKRNLETEACASGQEFLSMGSAGFSSADADCAWREKLRIYSLQGKTLED